MAKEQILVVGAGAIGRGFLPWVFPESRYDFVFVDVNDALVSDLQERGSYTSYMADDKGELQPRKVNVAKALKFSELRISDLNPATCYVAVGPRRVVEAVGRLKGYRGPIVLLENDDKSVELARASIGQDNIFFAIPDVIASNTASPEHLVTDPLSLHTEDGVLYVDQSARCAEGSIEYCDTEELRRQWLAKACIHNTPHCIAAYLGSFIRKTYIHEVMAVPQARKIVRGAIEEMLKALKLGWDIPHSFLDWYAHKELRRFSNVALHDPISRVAREPFRKLQLDGRLIGAALMCMRVGFVPVNILQGIAAALLFDDGSDPDRHIIFAKEFLPPPVVFSYLLGLRSGEPLHSILSENFTDLVRRLEGMREVASA
jgi:hypothetical protein